MVKEHLCCALVEIGAAATNTYNSILDMVRSLNAPDLLSNITNNTQQYIVPSFVTLGNIAGAAAEHTIIHETIAAITKMEKAEELQMQYTNVCTAGVQLLSDRFYRVLWEVALDEATHTSLSRLIPYNVNDLITTVWEDVPRTLLADRSYDYLTVQATGTVIFVHCYGYSYIKYKAGQIDGGYTVLLDTIEHALKLTAQVDMCSARRYIHGENIEPDEQLVTT